jgi:hypothetical protein
LLHGRMSYSSRSFRQKVRYAKKRFAVQEDSADDGCNSVLR